MSYDLNNVDGKDDTQVNGLPGVDVVFGHGVEVVSGNKVDLNESEAYLNDATTDLNEPSVDLRVELCLNQLKYMLHINTITNLMDEVFEGENQADAANEFEESDLDYVYVYLFDDD